MAGRRTTSVGFRPHALNWIASRRTVNAHRYPAVTARCGPGLDALSPRSHSLLPTSGWVAATTSECRKSD